MSPEVTIQITKDEYMELYRDSMTLQALEAAGVDNWEGYDEIDREWIDEQCEKEEERIDE